MKKIAVVLVAVLLLFSGCGNNDYRNVELSDFSVYIHTIDVGKPNYFRVITVNAIDDFLYLRNDWIRGYSNRHKAYLCGR